MRECGEAEAGDPRTRGATNVLVLSSGRGRCYLAAETRQEMRGWVAAINQRLRRGTGEEDAPAPAPAPVPAPAPAPRPGSVVGLAECEADLHNLTYSYSDTEPEDTAESAGWPQLPRSPRSVSTARRGLARARVSPLEASSTEEAAAPCGRAGQLQNTEDVTRVPTSAPPPATPPSPPSASPPATPTQHQVESLESVAITIQSLVSEAGSLLQVHSHNKKSTL